MDMKKTREELKKLIEKVYSLICSTPMFANDKLLVNMADGDVLMRKLNNKIMKTIKLLRAIQTTMDTAGALVNKEILHNFELYITDIMRSTTELKDLWERHNKIYSDAGDNVDVQEAIANMAVVYTEVFELDLTHKMISLFINFVASNATADRQRHLLSCMNARTMQAPYTKLCHSFNLLNIVGDELAKTIYVHVSEIVEVMSGLLSVHFSVIDYIIDCAMMSGMSNPTTAQFIKGTMESFKINSHTDYKFMLMCVTAPSMIKFYIAIHASMGNLVANMTSALMQGSAMVPREMMEMLMT